MGQSGGCAPLSPRAEGRSTRMLTSPAHSLSGDLGSLDAQHELFVPSLLSTDLSHRPASTPGHRMICSPGRSHSRTLRQSLLVWQEQEVRRRLSRQARTRDAELLCLSASVGFLPSAHHVPVLELCSVLNDPWYQRTRRANLCPQKQLRAACQGSDEALHDVHAAFSKMVALFLSLLRMPEDGEPTPSSASKSPGLEREWLPSCHTSG